jgi:hypothetical protein
VLANPEDKKLSEELVILATAVREHYDSGTAIIEAIIRHRVQRTGITVCDPLYGQDLDGCAHDRRNQHKRIVVER